MVNLEAWILVQVFLVDGELLQSFIVSRSYFASTLIINFVL